METLFRWIHLSDIHVGHGDAAHGWDQKLVMDALQQDVAALVKKEHAPVDAILVTGDIAFSGAGRSPTEYEEAKAWLLDLAKVAGVTPSQIFLVPGNHDINRAADRDRNTKRLVEGLRGGRDKIDAALADAGDRKLLAERMKAYLAFAAEFAPFCLRSPAPAAEARLFWVHRVVSRGGLGVRLVGLNTALLAADDQDQGKLHLGREQLSAAVREPPIEEGDLVMVLSHHPLQSGWLADERDADAWIRNRTHVHLSGHVHEAASEQARAGAGGAFVRIVAGSVHGEASEPASHGYSFGAVVRTGDQAKLRIWPRKWSPRNASFRIDQDNVPDGEKYAEHDLPVKLAPGAAPLRSAATAAAASSPIEVFVASCPADDELWAALETHLKRPLRKAMVELSSNQSIGYGEDVRAAVEAKLRSARIILILLSSQYLNSWDYSSDDLAIARERHEAGAAVVIPILLKSTLLSDMRSSDAGKEWFEGLQRLPRDGRPINQWPDRDEALTRIAKEIVTIAEKLKGTRP